MVLQLCSMCQGGLIAVLRSHIGVFIRLLAAEPRRTSQDLVSFIPLSVSLWNNLADPVFYGVGLAGFKSRANAFSNLLYSVFILFFNFSSSCWYCGAGVFGLIGCTTVQHCLTALHYRPPLLIIIILITTLLICNVKEITSMAFKNSLIIKIIKWITQKRDQRK